MLTWVTQAFDHNEKRILELHDEIARVRRRGEALNITLPDVAAALVFALPCGGASSMDPHMQLVQLMMDLEVCSAVWHERIALHLCHAAHLWCC